MDIGERVALARNESGLKQADLAAAVGLDRSALAKIETGARRVSAIELVALARELRRRIEWFVEPDPPAVTSYRRAHPDVATQPIDRELESLVRDVELVVSEDGALVAGAPDAFETPADGAAADALAARARTLLGLSPADPAHDLGDRVSRIGLFAFSIRLGEDDADAGTVLLARGGVTVVNGSREVGRRRLTLAHELGHFLVADEYTTDWRIASSGADRTESLLDRFARALLLPSDDLRARWAAWTSAPDETVRDAAVRAGSHYRVDMATLARRLRELDCVGSADEGVIRAVHTKRADIVEKGLIVTDELAPVWLPRTYERAVLGLYRSETISEDRALGLLLGTFDADALPDLPLAREDEIWAITS